MNKRTKQTKKILKVLLSITTFIGVTLTGLALWKGRNDHIYIGIGIILAGFVLYVLLSFVIIRRILTPPYFGKAYREYVVGNMQQAFALINKSIEARPNCPELYALRATFHLKEGHCFEAEQDAKTSIQINPKTSDGYAVLGLYFIMQGYYAEAKEKFLEALQLEPKHQRYYYYLGQIYYRLGEYSAAIDYLKKSIASSEISWDSLMSRYYWGCCLEELGEHGQAEELFETMRNYQKYLPNLEQQYNRWPENYSEISQIKEDIADLKELLASS